MNIERLIAAGLTTLQDPRAVARSIISMGFGPAESWMGLLLIAIVSSLLSSLTVLGVTGEAEAIPLLLLQPFTLAVMQFVALTLGAILVFVVGHQFGGTGSLADATALIVWLEVVFTAVQVLQILISLALPVLGVSFALFSLLVFFWVLCQFIAELHGFTAIWKVLIGVMATGLVVSFLIAIVMVILQRVGLIEGVGPVNA